MNNVIGCIRIYRESKFQKFSAMKAKNWSDPADRWQWRLSRSRPDGVWIDSAAPLVKQSPRAEKAATPVVMADGYSTSSFDLLNGLEVKEADDELMSQFDELFPRE